MTQPQRPGGFDMGRLTTGQKVLLAAGVLYLISMFLPWVSVDIGEAFGIDVGSVSANGFTGIGMISGILVIALLIWEGLAAAGTNVNLGTTSPALVGAILGGATAVFGIINFLTSLDGVAIGAFLGLLFSIALAYGAYVRFQESKIGGTAPPAM